MVTNHISKGEGGLQTCLIFLQVKEKVMLQHSVQGGRDQCLINKYIPQCFKLLKAEFQTLLLGGGEVPLIYPSLLAFRHSLHIYKQFI